MRSASACAPFMPLLPKKPTCTQAVLSPSWQKSDVLAPGSDLTRVVRRLPRNVGHEPRRSGARPVVLTRLEGDAVSRADHLDPTALALAQADTFGDPDRLPVRVGMPCSARARREM